MSGQDRGHKNERVEIQKEPDRIAELIISLGFCLNEQKEE
jgi:hypothetical protein